MRSGLLAVVGLMLTIGCGKAPQGSHSKELAAGSALVGTNKFTGVNEQGGVCSVELQLNDSGELKALRLSGTYTVDYKIPAPLSGLYGKYFYPGEFDSNTNINSGDVKISQGWFGNSVTVEGKGKPLFWDTPDNFHKVTVHGGLDHPESVTYHSSNRIVAVIPFVDTDLNCTDLKAAN